MSFLGQRARNHPQQIRLRGSLDAADDRVTEPAFFASLHARFAFTIDVAASALNTRLPRYYDLGDDGLAQSWRGEMVWCNPPFSSIEPWVRKAWSEYPAARGIVMILPANRTEQGWWQDLIEPVRDRPNGPLRVEFLPGRLRFIRPGADGIGPNERPPFGCCLAIWRAA